MQNKLIFVDYRGDVFKKGVYVINNEPESFLTTFSFYDAVTNSWCNIYTASTELSDYMLDSLDTAKPNSSLFINYKEAVRSIEISPTDALNGHYSILVYNIKKNSFKIYNPAIKGIGLMTSLSFIEDVLPEVVYVGGITSKVSPDEAISDAFLKYGVSGCFRLERINEGYYERIEEDLPIAKQHAKPDLKVVPK